jgi:hypothetical protein
MFNIWMFQKIQEGSVFDTDLTPYVRTSWTRSERARGGFWTAEFIITNTAKWQLWQWFDTMIDKRIVEDSYGIVTWEGESTYLELTIDGNTYAQSLDSELWHNRVKTQYTYPRIEDENQGALTYDPDGGNSLQDVGQDFSDWETTGAVDSVYMIVVTNLDATTCSGYLGAAFNTAAANDSIHVYRDLARTDSGWIGDETGKTPDSYVIEHVENAGAQFETDWAEDTGSSDIYGESEYIDVLPDECDVTAANAARDRRLTEHAYPKSVPNAVLAGGGNPEPEQNQLYVACSGYVFGMNRRFYETDVMPQYISTQISTLVAASEFVTAGTIVENTMEVPIGCGQIPLGIWDQCESFIRLGDVSGNRWTGGVRRGRVFDYQQAETTAAYSWRRGQLVDDLGHPVHPTLIKPDIIVRTGGPFSTTSISGNAWDNTGEVYIAEVEFIAPDRYRLIPDEGDVLVSGGV